MKITHQLQEVPGIMEFFKSHFDSFEIVKIGRDYSTFIVSHKDITTKEICPIIRYDQNGNCTIERYNQP